MAERKPYDGVYKNLFSNQEMVADLITRFFKPKWIEALDFSTLQHVSQSYVTDDLNKRDSDTIWRVRCHNEWLYLFIIIEFQARVDKFMAVRIMTYTGLLYEDVIKYDAVIRNSGQLPPVVPIVLYCGSDRWTAAQSMQALMAPGLPKALRHYQPQMAYWLLDQGRYKLDSDTACSDSVVAPLIALEQCQKPADILQIVNNLVKLLNGAKFDTLRRAYTVYLNRILEIKKVLPDTEFHELHEVHSMLSERVHMWMEEGHEKGFKKGLEAGREQGLEQGLERERKLLIRLLQRRFGVLSLTQVDILNKMSNDELIQKIGDRLLEASSLEELIGHDTISA